MTFRRTPTQRGNTDVPVVAIPRIVGTARRNSLGDLPISPDAELCIETDTMGGVPVSVILTSANMTAVVSTINTSLGANGLAEDVDGCLAISTLTAGQGAFVRILPAAVLTTSDAAPDLGFFLYPHPQAEVQAGTIESSEVRPDSQANSAGTTMLPVAADRLSRNFNRALAMMGRNADFSHTQLTNPVALPTVIPVDLTDPAWVGRTAYIAATPITEINLSALTRGEAGLPGDPLADAGRVWVGSLTQNSSLDEISKYFKIVDENDNEVVDSVTQRVVRVALVTRGSAGPGFVAGTTDWSAPVNPQADTAATTPDGLGVLGVDLVKQTSLAIGEVLGDRSTVHVPGATFVSNGVVPGDKAVISGCLITSPKTLDGTYIVEQVVGEEYLILRPSDPSDDGDLTPSTAPSPGNIVVSSGGQFQDNIWITLYPPLNAPVQHSSCNFKIILGLERSVGQIQEETDSLLRAAVRAAPEVDGFVMRDIVRQFNFGGVYDGQAPRSARGAGGFGNFTRPAVLNLKGVDVPHFSGGSFGSGDVDGVYLISTGALDFTEDLIGHFFGLSGVPGFPDYGICLAVELDGNRRLKLLRLDDNFGEPIGTASGINFIYQMDIFPEFPAAMIARSVRTPSLDRSGGFVALHEHTDTGLTSNDQLAKYGIASIEQLVSDNVPGNMLGLLGILHAPDEIELSFDPADNAAIFGPENAALAADVQDQHSTLVRIVGGPDVGWYRVRKVLSAAAGSSYDGVQLVNLDGSAVTLSALISPVSVAFYNIIFASDVPYGVDTTRRSAIRAFVNWFQTLETAQDGVVSVSWRGGDANSAGIKIKPNDLEGVVDSSGGGAQGWGVYTIVGAPLSGGSRIEAYDNTLGAWWTYSKNTVDVPDITGLPSAGLGHFGSVTGQIGQSTALTFRSTLWLGRSISPGSTTWDNSALVVNTTAAAGWVAYAPYFDATSSPYGTGSYEEYDAPTRLGHPAVLYPASAGATESAPVEPPDSTLFSHAHDGVLDISGMLNQPLGALIGCKVSITSGANSGDDYRISAVDETVQKAALNGPTPIAASYTADLVVYGARWRESHLDIGDWTQVGSIWARGDASAVSILTSGYWTTEQWTETQVADNPLQFIDVDVGTGIWAAGVSSGTGTISAVSGLSVTGSGTLFLSEVNVGDFIKVSANGNAAWTRVASISSNTSLTLCTAYPFGGSSGAYSICTNPGVQPDMPGLLGGAPLPMGNFWGVGRSNGTPTAVLAGDPLAWAEEWQESYEEPRAPVPNAAALVGTGTTYLTRTSLYLAGAASLSTAGYRGSLAVDGIVLTQIAQDDPAMYIVSTVSPLMGGSLVFTPANGSPGDSTTFRITFRGLHGVSRDALKLTVRSILWRPSAMATDCSVTARLVLSTGQVIASSTPYLLSPSTNPEQVTFSFTEDAFVEISSDEFYQRQAESNSFAVCVALEIDSFLAGDELYIGKFEVIDEVLPLRQYGPQEVVGVHRAAEYRLLSQQRAYLMVGAARASLLNSDEYGLLEMSTNSFNNAARFVEGNGVGLIRAHDGALNRMLRPAFHTSEFFKKGASGSVITAYHPYFDPLWYYYASGLRSAPNLTIAEANDHADIPNPGDPAGYDDYRSTFVPPGRTGFILPLENLPQGAVLSDLSFVLGFQPSFVEDTSAPGTIHSNFQVWRRWSPVQDLGLLGITNIARTDHEKGIKSDWDADEGYIVRVWRRQVFDMGSDLPFPQVPPAYANTKANLLNRQPGEVGGPDYAQMPETGWAEVIWQKEYDLSGVTEPTPADYSLDIKVSSSSSNNTRTEFFSNEYLDRRTANLLQDNDVEGPETFQSEVARASKLRIDNSQFEYFVTIEFWIGCRVVDSSGTWGMEYTYYSTLEDVGTVDVRKYDGSTGPSVYGITNRAYRSKSASPTVSWIEVEDGPAVQTPVPPKVRFRGLRVGYLTDRPGRT